VPENEAHRPRTRPARRASRSGLRRLDGRAIATCLIAALAILHPIEAGADDAVAIVEPFETRVAVPLTPLDALILAEQKKRGIEPANACSDVVFIRRVHLDLIGALPEPGEVRRFLADRRPGRRARLIDALFEREEFADLWSLRWCDALRVKAEFPINLWPNAVQAYHRWVREAIRDNRPYDEFARDLLTASGSNFRVPPVNFWRAVQSRDAEALAEAAGLTFMGVRTGSWEPERRAGMAAFFSRVAYKRTREWKEEIVFPDPAPAGPLDAVFPDGRAVRIAPSDDPREVFADWLIRAENPWFARAVVNRIWAWLFGRGVVHEADDLRPDNPASIPCLLEYLAEQLVESGWDLRHVYRLILNSRSYQQSPIPRGANPPGAFACYPVRRLDAEILIDALCWVGGTGEEYSSAIPEPFTFIPADQRTIALADGSITSPFLELFGRAARDSGRMSERSNAPSDAQRLHLLNSTQVLNRIRRSPRLVRAFKESQGSNDVFIRETYLTLLSRHPTPAESATALATFRTKGRRRQEAACDLAWALINSKEFLYRH
jgi:uncharacterized protein DUF1553/uncharacterized protein DUF1549